MKPFNVHSRLFPAIVPGSCSWTPPSPLCSLTSSGVGFVLRTKRGRRPSFAWEKIRNGWRTKKPMPDLQVYPQSVIASWPADGATGPLRIIIENVQPEIDAGRFPIKRVLGEEVAVKADIHVDGHEVLAAVLQYRFRDETTWRESPMVEEPNDSWR